MDHLCRFASRLADPVPASVRNTTGATRLVLGLGLPRESVTSGTSGDLHWFLSAQNGLAQALRELGTIERTLFTLDWIQNRDLRQRATIGLNKGEAMLSTVANLGSVRLASTCELVWSIEQLPLSLTRPVHN